MGKEFDTITRWLKDSGLKVYELKKEVYLFRGLDCQQISLNINNTQIRLHDSMNVPGVTLDCKLTLSTHINNTLKKAKKALNTIKLLRTHFTMCKLRQIITSNFDSIMYYFSEIWYFPYLSPQLKQQLISASAYTLELVPEIMNSPCHI
jgi:hypothetical protein